MRAEDNSGGVRLERKVRAPRNSSCLFPTISGIEPPVAAALGATSVVFSACCIARGAFNPISDSYSAAIYTATSFAANCLTAPDSNSPEIKNDIATNRTPS